MTYSQSTHFFYYSVARTLSSALRLKASAAEEKAALPVEFYGLLRCVKIAGQGFKKRLTLRMYINYNKRGFKRAKSFVSDVFARSFSFIHISRMRIK